MVIYQSIIIDYITVYKLYLYVHCYYPFQACQQTQQVGLGCL